MAIENLSSRHAGADFFESLAVHGFKRKVVIEPKLIACILIFIVAVAYVAWGAMAAASPDHLLGPGGKAILPAGYKGSTKAPV